MTAAMAGNLEIVEFFIAAYDCTVEEIVDSYKLLGATYVDKFYDLSGAFEFWRKAHSLSSKCSAEYFKSLVNTDKYFMEAYSEITEFQTEDNLNELSRDPDMMKMQSLIIRERILGIHHPETFYYISYRGGAYAEGGEYSRCLYLWLYNLEKHHTHSKPLSDVVQNSFVSMVELFSLMVSDTVSSVRICDIFRVLKLAIKELEFSCQFLGSDINRRFYEKLDNNNQMMFDSERNNLDKHFLIVLQLIGFMCRLSHQMTKQEWKLFRKSIRELIALEPRSSCSYTILHIVCILNDKEMTKPQGLSLCLDEIFTFLVDISNNLNIIDLFGNTPLHLLFKQTVFNSNWADYLLDHGAHLDVRNEKGLTPLQVCTDKSIQSRYRMKHLTLQCLCAQLIAEKKIDQGVLSRDVQRFIRRHQKKGSMHKSTTTV